MNCKYTKNQINNIIKTFKETNSYQYVSNYYNIPLSSVKSILYKRGIRKGNRKLKISKDKGEKLVQKSYKILEGSEKYSFNTLCNLLKVNPTSFKNYILEEGIKGILEECSSSYKRKTSLTPTIKKEIIKFEEKGCGIDLIGRKLDIDGGTVRRYLIKYYGEEKYKERHSINKFYTPFYSGWTNERGDRFHSTLEELVADFLYEKNISYETQSYIKFKDGKTIYPDFYLKDYNLYLEVFGMSNVPFYIKSMDVKMDYYNTYNIEYLGLFYENFKYNNWKEILLEKLKK